MSALDGKALLEHGEAIARRYAKYVGPDVAEDLRAEAVLRALRSPAPDGRIEPWLERIYKNLLIDHWRRFRHVTVDIDTLDTVAATSTPEDAVLAHERRLRVRACLRRLPREARRVLLSRYYGELDEATTATRMGIAGPTVRTRVHRALSRLRIRLGDLRAWCPTIWGKLTAQLAAIGAAPLLVAALIVAGTAAPKPPPTSASIPEPAPSPITFMAGAEPQPLASPALPVPSQPRVSRKALVAPPSSSVPFAIERAPSIVTEILWPERIDIVAEPEASTPPCLVQAPTSFALQIEKMVEDEL